MLNRRRWSSLSIASAMCLLVLSGAALAQSAVDGDAMNLTLSDALQIALENNLGLEAARVAPEIAAEQIVFQEGAFDGTFSVGAQYIDDTNDQTITDKFSSATSPGSDDSETLQGTASWTDPLNFGASYSVEYRPRNFSSTSRTVIDAGFFQDSVRDSKAGAVVLRYDMPLLRGFGKQVNTEGLVLARTDAEMSLDTMRGEAITVIEQAEGAYWDVVASRAELRVANLALERAEDLLELNRKKVEVGTLAPIEITQARAEVASKTEGVIVAEVNLLNAEDELRKLLSFAADDPAWSRAIMATDRPSFTKQEIDLDGAIEVAMATRPDILNARRNLSQKELSAIVARKNARQQLDLNAQLSPSTFDNDQAFQFPTAPTQNSATNVEGDGMNWQIGLTYTMKVRNRQRRANERIAALNLSKAGVDLLNAEQSVRVEVRTAIRNIESGYKRVEAARINVDLQTEKLDAEQKKFDNGMSTSFEVLTFQNDLADAELRLISAGLDYAKGLTAIERAKGTLLDARG
ncbi:MAG: TolC family protein, partial [Deltaproteobacteria bacterium]|nr:TolC family protein [Deltaproteobacteria bacterium]